MNPEHTNAYFIRGNAHRLKNGLNNAIADFTRAIELDPKHADAYFNRGITYRESELAKAIEDLTEAIKLKPDDVATYYIFRGLAWLRLGEQEKVESDLTTAKNMGMDINTGLDKIVQEWKTLGIL